MTRVSIQTVRQAHRTSSTLEAAGHEVVGITFDGEADSFEIKLGGDDRINPQGAGGGTVKS